MSMTWLLVLLGALGVASSEFDAGCHSAVDCQSGTLASEVMLMQINLDMAANKLEVENSPWPSWSRHSESFPQFTLKKLDGLLVDNRLWEADEQEIYMRVVRPTDRVLFLGGNIGTGCALVDRILENPTQQLCVEPNPQLFDRLEGNRNMTGSRFQIVKAVISDSPEIIRLSTFADDRFRLGSTSTVGGNVSGIEVAKLSLAKALGQLSASEGSPARFDSLLTDCEGCLCGFLDEYPHMLDELHSLAYEADGSNSQCYRDLEDKLREKGFAFDGCAGTQFRAWVRADSPASDRVPEVSISGACGMDERERNLFLGSLNNTESPFDAPDSYWADYIRQKLPRPRPLENSQKVTAHTYWHGEYGSFAALAVKSFLATQDPDLTRVVVWLDVTTPNISKKLQALVSQNPERLEVKLFNYHKEVAGTALDGKWADIQHVSKVLGHGHWPADRTKSDLVRYVILFNYGGLWFDSDVMFLRDMSPLLPYEWAYPWSKHFPAGNPENHTLNAALMRLFPGSAANIDMIARVAEDKLPFGLWGLSSLRDRSMHKDLHIVDVTLLDPIWKDYEFFEDSGDARTLLGHNHDHGEQHRFDWFFTDDAEMRDAGLHLLRQSGSLAYHWHNHWENDARLGSAFRLYKDFFDCVLAGGACGTAMQSLTTPPLARERGWAGLPQCSKYPWQAATGCSEQAQELWNLAQLYEALPEFAMLYAERPSVLVGDTDELGVNHAFALWFVARSLKPKVIVESNAGGTGLTTWLLRQAAGQDAKLFSLTTTAESHLLYRDEAATYLPGDFANAEWDRIVPQAQRGDALMFFNDQQPHIQRVEQMMQHGFAHVLFGDNYAAGSGAGASVNKLCTPVAESRPDAELLLGVADADDTTLGQHRKNQRYLREHLEAVFEFPAVYDGCLADAPALLTDDGELLAHRLPAVPKDKHRYWSLHPPYLKLRPA